MSRISKGGHGCHGKSRIFTLESRKNKNISSLFPFKVNHLFQASFYNISSYSNSILPFLFYHFDFFLLQCAWILLSDRFSKFVKGCVCLCVCACQPRRVAGSWRRCPLPPISPYSTAVYGPFASLHVPPASVLRACSHLSPCFVTLY